MLQSYTCKSIYNKHFNLIYSGPRYMSLWHYRHKLAMMGDLVPKLLSQSKVQNLGRLLITEGWCRVYTERETQVINYAARSYTSLFDFIAKSSTMLFNFIQISTSWLHFWHCLQPCSRSFPQKQHSPNFAKRIRPKYSFCNRTFAPKSSKAEVRCIPKEKLKCIPKSSATLPKLPSTVYNITLQRKLCTNF